MLTKSQFFHSTKSSNELHSDLKIIKNWEFQWKMYFYPDPLKQANGVFFSKNSNVIDYPDLAFNNHILHKAFLRKHFGLILDDKLNFKEHMKITQCDAKKDIGISRKLHHSLREKFPNTDQK